MRRVLIPSAALLLATSGCARLRPGDLPPRPQSAVFVVRGYLDWYSAGMDQLTDELRAAGAGAVAFREEQWGQLAATLAARPPRPLVLIGFSYGADDVILIARRLNDHHVPVDLLVTVDPVTPAAVPANVRRCVNFYEPNGFWDVFPWLRGVPLRGDPGAVENVNVRAQADLNEPGTSHATIAANDKVHRAIVALTLQALQR